MGTVSKWHAPGHPPPVWFFSDCFSFWQILGCFPAPRRSSVVPSPAKRRKSVSQSFLDILIMCVLCARRPACSSVSRLFMSSISRSDLFLWASCSSFWAFSTWSLFLLSITFWSSGLFCGARPLQNKQNQGDNLNKICISRSNKPDSIRFVIDQWRLDKRAKDENVAQFRDNNPYGYIMSANLDENPDCPT